MIINYTSLFQKKTIFDSFFGSQMKACMRKFFEKSLANYEGRSTCKTTQQLAILFFACIGLIYLQIYFKLI